jgi:predicted nucleotidyltransferase
VNFFETISTEASKRNLRFLVIGGLAISFYGYSRDTADLDLLIHKGDRETWLNFFSELKYATHHDGGSFLQLSSSEKNAWPVDLMLVRETTFEPMYVASREVDLYGAHSHIPSLEHLLMLKLHALKNGRINRFLKDFLDVEHLIRINKLDIKSENMRQLFSKYGTLDLYEKVSAALASE